MITTNFNSTKLFYDMWVKHHGMLQFIISDKETCVLEGGMKLLFSTMFHPQIDGQMERVNGVLNQYFRNYVNANKKDLGKHLDMVEFYYNSTMHSTTKVSLLNECWEKN